MKQWFKVLKSRRKVYKSRKVYKIVPVTIYKIQFYIKQMLFPFQLELPI